MKKWFVAAAVFAALGILVLLFQPQVGEAVSGFGWGDMGGMIIAFGVFGVAAGLAFQGFVVRKEAQGPSDEPEDRL